MKTRLFLLLAFVLCLVPLPVFAHPGHGHTEPDTLRHYLTEPVHVLVLAAVVAAVVTSWLGYRRVAGISSSKIADRPGSSQCGSNQPDTQRPTLH